MKMLRLSLLSLFFVLFASLSPVFSQEKQIQAEKELRKGEISTLREQKVYVPYENFSDVLGSQEKGIFIPYSDFLKLWEEATKKPLTDEDPVPPVDAAIVYAQYKGVVSGDMAEFRAEVKITALKDKWATLSLKFRNIAVTSLSLNDQAPLVTPKDGGLDLVLPEKGSYVLKIDFSTKVNSLPGKKFLEFDLPSSSLTKLDLAIPGTDLDVKIEPMLSMKTSSEGGSTQFSSFVSPDGKVNISWLSKSTEARAAKNLLFAELFTQLTIKESVCSADTMIHYSITQAKAGDFRVRIPPSFQLVRVDGKNIKDWDIKDQVLTVNLFEEVSDFYALSLLLEKPRSADERSFPFEPVEVLDAVREEGVVAVKSDAELRVKAEKLEMVTQIDPLDVKERISLDNLVAVYKYMRRPFTLALGISKIQPRIRSHQKVLVSVGDAILDHRTSVWFSIRDAGVFSFRFLVPQGFRVVDVGTDKTVDSYAISKEDDKNILRVMLKNKAAGDYVLPIRLETDKADGNTSIEIPKIVCLDAEKEDGIIAISIRKNLKLATRDIKSLRPVSLEDLGKEGFVQEDERNEIAAGYRYAASDYSGLMELEKRSTRVTATVERNIRLDETIVKISDAIRYSILYAPVSTFRVEISSPNAGDAVITGDNIKEKRFVPGSEADKGVWEVELHAPQIDKYTLNISLETRLAGMKTGEKRNAALPVLKVLDVFNESGFLAVSKSPDLQVDAATENLEPLDAKELPPSMDKSQAVLAYRYLGHPYSASLESTKHDYEKVLDAIVNQAHFDIVISREGVAKTEGVFRIQNSNRQSLELVMPEGTGSIYAVFIAGRKATISRGADDRSKIIMLPKDIEPGREFTVRIIYETSVRKDFGLFGRIALGCCEIKDVPESKISWRLYLPVRYSYLYMKGSMEPNTRYDEMFNRVSDSVSSMRAYEENRIQYDDQQIHQQSDEKGLFGLDVQLVREGRLYAFSKLDRNGYLHVVYIKKAFLFYLSVFLFIGLSGVLIFASRKTKTSKILFVLYAIGGAVVLWLFLPQGFKYFGKLCFWSSALSGVIIAVLAGTKNKNAEQADKASTQNGRTL